MRQQFTAADISTISQRAQQMGKEVFNQSGNFGPYPPPSLKQVIMFPGYDGGMEWGGSAADPDGILYVNINEIPWFYQLVATKNPDGQPLSFGERHYRILCASCHGIDTKGDAASGFPALDNLENRYNHEAILQLISRGGGRMPAFDQIPEERRNAIVDFLLGLEPPIETKANISPGIPEASNDPHKEQSILEADENIPPFTFRGFHRWQDEEGYPAIKPPWGTLNAVDLNTGTIKWKVPLGEYQELTDRGIEITGTENYGGPVVTAGGLIFIGASSDAKFRVFDKATGEKLWEYDLPFDGHATPSTYLANGKQFVVISCGGSKMNPAHGGTLVAFSLPK
jgi:quinoprotein glucose dehydrogenase